MQQPQLQKAQADRPVVIEVDGEPTGVVVPAEGGWRFVAVKFPVFAIDGEVFDSIGAAELAASAAAAKADTI